MSTGPRKAAVQGHGEVCCDTSQTLHLHLKTPSCATTFRHVMSAYSPISRCPSPWQVLVEQSLLGWKEFELEVG